MIFTKKNINLYKYSIFINNMKRGLGFFLLVFLTQAVSAQFFGSYGSFSITDFFSSIDPETITLGLLFFIFFALLFYALSRFFKDQHGQPNKGIAGTIAFALAFLIIYGIYRSGFSLENLFYGVGIPSGILPIILLALAVLVIWGLGRRKDEFGKKTFSLRRGLGGFFMLLGLLFILLSIFTDIFYEKTTVFIIGLGLLLIGLWLGWRKKKWGKGPRRELPITTDSENYTTKARELAAKQRYEYYRQLEAQKKAQGVQQRRAQEREERRREAYEEEVKRRYIRRFGKRAWKKRAE